MHSLGSESCEAEMNLGVRHDGQWLTSRPAALESKHGERDGHSSRHWYDRDCTQVAKASQPECVLRQQIGQFCQH